MILPEGFHLVRGWTRAAFADIRDAVSWSQSTIRIYGREVAQPRLTSWMGDAPYTYSGRRHEPAPLPTAVETMRLELERMCSMFGASTSRRPIRFNSVLGNLYRDGSDSVAWHADDEPELGHEPVIASLSLGAARRFSIRHNATHERWQVELEHGDLLLMSGASQRSFQHAVPKTQRAIGERVNLTFREVRAR